MLGAVLVGFFEGGGEGREGGAREDATESTPLIVHQDRHLSATDEEPQRENGCGSSSSSLLCPSL